MKITTLIDKLNKALRDYGDLDVTVSETLWLYNSIKEVRLIKHPYQNEDTSVIELTDYSTEEDDDEFWIRV